MSSRNIDADLIESVLGLINDTMNPNNPKFPVLARLEIFSDGSGSISTCYVKDIVAFGNFEEMLQVLETLNAALQDEPLPANIPENIKSYVDFQVDKNF